MALLLCSSVAAAYIISSLVAEERSVRHAYTVEVALGEVDSALANVGRARMFLIGPGADAGKDVDNFKAAQAEVQRQLEALRRLTIDNQKQQLLWVRLNELSIQRIATLQRSVDLMLAGGSDLAKQAELTADVANFALETATTVEQMKQNEDKLVVQRSEVSQRLLLATLSILLAVLAFSIFLFWLHYRLLNRELKERQRAEMGARKVSARLLRLQDIERRKFARELHDSLGQNLVAAKMVAASIKSKGPEDRTVDELTDLLEECVRETRTLSYLLHPPLLDEIGLASAARSLAEGLSQRTGLEIIADIPSYSERLPGSVELVLFRVLQEALTNIHRHSESPRAEISIRQYPDRAVLTVRDFGKGIPSATLERFRSSDPHVGIGLVGMRERVRELGGTLSLDSDAHGTRIGVVIPLHGIDQELDEHAVSAVD